MASISDIASFLQEQGQGNVYPAQTVDRITHRSEEKPLAKVAVTWMATNRVIHQTAKAEENT